MTKSRFVVISPYEVFVRVDGREYRLFPWRRRKLFKLMVPRRGKPYLNYCGVGSEGTVYMWRNPEDK